VADPWSHGEWVPNRIQLLPADDLSAWRAGHDEEAVSK
jgi:hypothetical protein